MTNNSGKNAKKFLPKDAIDIASFFMTSKYKIYFKFG